jgi:hypothetical protein
MENHDSINFLLMMNITKRNVMNIDQRARRVIQTGCAPEQSGAFPPKGSSFSGAGRRRGGVAVITRKISGHVGNDNVVSETFAQTGMVFFCWRPLPGPR